MMLRGQRLEWGEGHNKSAASWGRSGNDAPIQNSWGWGKTIHIPGEIKGGKIRFAKGVSRGQR